MKDIKNRAQVFIAIGLAIATFFVIQMLESSKDIDSLPGKVLRGVDTIPSISALLIIAVLLFVGFMLLMKKKWIFGIILLTTIVLSAPFHSAATSYAKSNIYEKGFQNLKVNSLSFPLDLYPELYRPLQKLPKFRVSKGNITRSLPCVQSGCLVKVTGQYLDRMRTGESPTEFGPTGNCNVTMSDKLRSQLPGYVGEKPCFGALMFSKDGGTSYQGIIADRNSAISTDDITRQVGIIYSSKVHFKFYSGKNSNGFGPGIEIRTYEIINNPT